MVLGPSMMGLSESARDGPGGGFNRRVEVHVGLGN
jgi:hypothetical protein